MGLVQGKRIAKAPFPDSMTLPLQILGGDFGAKK